MAAARKLFAAGEGCSAGSRWSLERLPDGIINEILLKLSDLESLCTIACVSRNLRSAVGPVLASRSSLDLSAFCPDSETLQRMLSRFEGVKSLTIDCLQVDTVSFIDLLGAQIEELNLLKCSSSVVHILETVGERCPNLRVLSVEATDRGLSQLIRGLVALLKNTSFLESLSIKIQGTGLCCIHLPHFCSFLPATLKMLKLEPVVGSYFIQPVLTHRYYSHLLQHAFRFSSPRCSDGLNLQKLSLLLDVISDQLMLSIVESLPLLVDLYLEDNPDIEPQLPRDLSNTGLQSLGALHHLTTLSIIRNRVNLSSASFKRVNDLGMFILFESCSGLESVKLGGFSKVTDAGFSSILHSLKKLKKFEVRNASLLSDLAFHDMRKVAGSVVELKLLSCKLLTSDALEELSSFGKLEMLDISGCRSIANPCISYISNLYTLSSLTLAGSDITNDGLAMLGRGSTSITHLSIKGCKRISERGIHKLFHGEGNIGKKLSYLDISYMPGISDAAISTIASTAKALTNLSMRYCFFVTNAAVELLASRGTLRDGSALLRRLDLCHCSGLSNDLTQILDKDSFHGLHWLGLGSTALKSRKDHFDLVWIARPWLTVCYEGCELGCSDGWLSNALDGR